jgi:hypothetical protein
MKTTVKKTLSSNWRAGKFGHVKFTIKGIKGIFKLNPAIKNQDLNSHATTSGFTRIEKDEALALEAEASRDQGKVYANITPIR